MATSPSESHYAAQLLKRLRLLPETWCFKVHGGPFQQAGIPDILGCHYGRLFAIELKRGDARTTYLQRTVLLKIADAGGLTSVWSTSFSPEVVVEWLVSSSKTSSS